MTGRDRQHGTTESPAVDAAALDALPAVGDDVHLSGTVTNGTTVLATDGVR